MRSLRRVLMVLGLWCALCAVPTHSSAQGDVPRRARDFIASMDLDAAAQLLAGENPDGPRVALERARLAIYEMDCDAATVILARQDVQRLDDGATLADIAHGCSRATAAVTTNRDEGLGVDVQWQDEHDAPLGPVLLETVASARTMLARDLGVDWPHPTRIVVVRDSLSLSAMTGLPYASAKTTGTVAVAKWGRVTLVSPRATLHGYLWRDTVVHELTHLAVTRASGDRAPLWLQEGVAKYEESRWRPAQPFDDWPPADAVARGGIDSGRAYPLDKLGPSIAMLPTAEAATLAFAEVTSFVRFYLKREGDDALPKLLRAIKEAPDASAALVAASGADIKTWDTRWRAYLATRPEDGRLLLSGLSFGSKRDQRHLTADRDQRDRARLAELLVSQGHPSSALKELDHLDAAGRDEPREIRERRQRDPVLGWLRGLALEETDAAIDGDEKRLFDDPQRVLSPYGPWWASRGRWLRARGDEGASRSAFSEAVANDPLDAECACEVRPGEPATSERSADPLCIAAQNWAKFPFDD